jgi:dethiobiotin synthetase
MPLVVVLGTGTGVGKTHVTAALGQALTAANPGATVVALKPVETGIQPWNGSPCPGSDAAKLEFVSHGSPRRPHPLYAFREPISAHLAARRAKVRISLPSLVRWVHGSQHTLHDTTGLAASWVLVETAGGALSPLTAKVTNADFARMLGPAIWVLVAPDSLGVFHDVRATLLGLSAISRAPDYLVLSQARTPDAATGLNAPEFRRIGLPRPIAVLGRETDARAALGPLVRAMARSDVGRPSGR